jgi:competence protein ComEC
MLLIIITLLCGCDKNNLLTVNVIDVGQGDSILIQTPSKKNILIDAGDEKSDRIVKTYLRKKFIRKIDMLIATHPDSDHIGGIDNVIDEFDIAIVSMPEKTSESESYYNLLKSCRRKDIQIKYLKRDDFIKVEDDLSIQVLSPNNSAGDSNLNSIVFYMQYLEKKFLFTGDAEEENEQDILNTYDLEEVDFLKVGHHGSKSSSSPEFIERIDPDISVISCGYKNKYGHPHQETLNTLIKSDSEIYRTDKNGDLVFYSDGKQIFTKKKYIVD